MLSEAPQRVPAALVHCLSFSFLSKKSEEVNHFSQESKDLIIKMGNTEIFKFYETSSKRQCPDCDAHWEVGIVCTAKMHAVCGTESTIQQRQI